MNPIPETYQIFIIWAVIVIVMYVTWKREQRVSARSDQQRVSAREQRASAPRPPNRRVERDLNDVSRDMKRMMDDIEYHEKRAQRRASARGERSDQQRASARGERSDQD